MDKSGGSGSGAAGGDSRDGGPSPTTTPPSPSSSPAATAVGPSLGCGTGSSSSSSSTPAVTATPMTLNVTTTTGGSFSVVVDGDNSVENLKKIISKKLKVSKDRICLLHRERELHDGSLRDNGLMDGSKLILTPNVETGLLAQRAENTVMQALESLNDNQVNDFLSGKSPLNLSVRLGDHMMLIQLQLSTLNPSSQSGSRSKTHKSRTITGSSSSTSTSSSSSSAAAAIASTSSSNLIQASSSRSHSSRTTTFPVGFRRVATTAAESSSSTSRALVEHVNEAQTLTKQEIENIHSIVKNLAESGKQTVATVSSPPPSTSSRTEPMETDAEPRFGASSESPIKSLSNLVSSSINANIPPGAVSDPSAVPICTDPISANLTSCLCKRLDSNDNNSCESNCLSRASPAPSSPQPSTSASASNLHRTAQNPIMRHKSKVQTLKKHISFDGSTLARTEPDIVQPVSSVSAPNSPQRPDQLPHQYHLHQPQPGPSGTQTRTTTTSTVLNTTPDPNSIENPALAEASRNLTQTLRKLSKRVFTNKVADVAAQEAARNVNSGAVIESMKHHGKGIYSGTFSGTLNPALQDKFGRPKRDISTIIHILNDLLSAAPQCARSGTKIYFEPSQSSASQSQSSSAATALTSGGSGSSAGASGGVAVGSSQTTAANGMGASSSGTSFTTPVAAPSPRLMSRCVPTPIQTKKFPSNGTITSATIASGANGVATVTAAGPTGSNCTNCTSTSRTISLDPAVPSTSRSCYHHHHHHHHHQHQHHGHAHQQQKVTVAPGAASAAPKVLCKCGHPLAATTASTQCQRCAAISAAELENSKTKSKLDNLRLIMQQKKERREARKQKCAPYSTTTPPSTSSSSTSSAMVAAAAAAVGASGSTPAVVVPHRQPALTNTSASSSSETSPESTTAAAIASNPGTASAAAQESTSVGGGGSSSAASSAATATATATTTTSATEAAQSHQLVEEVDTVA